MTLALGLLLAVGSVQGREWGPPQLLAELSSQEITESSGIAASPTASGVFYTHNDSGDTARFFRFDKSGKVTGEWSLEGVSAIDWEDMASARVGGKSYLYLGDIGDNLRRRNSISVHRVEEPTGNSGSISPIETYTLKYPDAKRDCEALIVVPKTGDILLVTKARDNETVVYHVPAPRGSGTYTLKRVGNLKIDTGGFGGKLVTAADASPDGRHVVVRTYSGAVEFQVDGQFLSWVKASPSSIRLPLEVQGEAICYSADGTALLTTSEGVPCPVSILPLRKSR